MRNTFSTEKVSRSGGMVDAHASGACGATRAGSSPVFGRFFLYKERTQRNFSYIDFIANAKQTYVIRFSFQTIEDSFWALYCIKQVAN